MDGFFDLTSQLSSARDPTTMTSTRSDADRIELANRLTSFANRLEASRSKFQLEADLNLVDELLQFSANFWQDGSRDDPFANGTRWGRDRSEVRK